MSESANERRLDPLVVPDWDCLIQYLEAHRDLSLDGDEWEGATAVIDWLQSMIEEIRHNKELYGKT